MIQPTLLYHHRTRGTGVEGVHIRGIVKGFERRGWNVKLLSPPGVIVEGIGQSHSAPRPDSGLWRLISDASPQALFELLELAYNFYSLAALRRALNESRVRVIYERYSLFSWAGTWLARRRGIPIVLEVNDATVIVRSRPLSNRWLAGRIEAWIFRNATCVVTVSEKFRQRICERHGLRSEDVRVLPNAVDTSLIAEYPAVGRPDRFTVGMVAAFLPWHGLEFVIKTIGSFLKANNARLLLVGEGPDRRKVQHWIEKLELQPQVELAGHVPAARVPELIRQMDVCVIGNLAEHASPMKLFEYMACGKAVVAPAHGPVREIVAHKRNAWLFEPLQPASLLEAIEALHGDPELRERLGAAARETIVSKHTWDHRVRDLETWIMPAASAAGVADGAPVGVRVP